MNRCMDWCVMWNWFVGAYLLFKHYCSSYLAKDWTMKRGMNRCMDWCVMWNWFVGAYLLFKHYCSSYLAKDWTMKRGMNRCMDWCVMWNWFVMRFGSRSVVWNSRVTYISNVTSVVIGSVLYSLNSAIRKQDVV